jgi:hypothetical protein
MFSDPNTIVGHGANAHSSESMERRSFKDQREPPKVDLTPSPNGQTSAHQGAKTPELKELADSNHLFEIALVFTNRLGVSTALGNLTHCAAERMPIEFYHEHSLHFSAYTFYLGKRWYLWRFKNILQCWFCQNCNVIDLQNASNMASTSPTAAG